MKKSLSVVLVTLCSVFAPAQQTKMQKDLQDAIQARYRLSVIGPGAFGLRGGEDSVRKIGGTLVIVRKGLYGAFDRDQITSNAIKDGKRTLLSGKEDVPLQPGERFYANSVSVGSDFVSIGMLGVDPRNAGTKVGRVWTSVNFFFNPEIVREGKLNAMNAVMDQWILPADSLPNTPSNPLTPPAVSVASSLPGNVELKPGMAQADVVSALGTPIQSITFNHRTWLTYPALVALLQDGKLTSIDRPAESTGTLSLTSDPAGAEIYVDGELAGTTPASLLVPVGSHKIELQANGSTVWAQNVRVFPGATINLKKAPADGK